MEKRDPYRLHLVLIATMAFAGAVGLANADPITVVDHSFEAAKTENGGPLGAAGESTPTMIAPWVMSGNQGVGWTAAHEYSAGVQDGDIYAWCNGAGYISQALAATLQADTTYTLTVAVGQRKDHTSPGYGIELWAGDNKLASDYSTNQGGTGSLPAQDSWKDVKTTFGSDLSVTPGQALEIRLIGYGVQGNYDNVRLDAARKSPLLFKDNFNVGNTGNFDNADLAGRRSGSLQSLVFLRSAMAIQQIENNQLKMVWTGANTGRVRFQDSSGWYDWAAGTTGEAIIDAGHLRIEFDWTAVNTTSGNWISFSIGHDDGPEPGNRIIDADTDYGLLLQCNGGTQRFDNGNGAGTGVFTPSATAQHVILDFFFTSFADGESVSAMARVGGTKVDEYTFTLDNNGGKLFMELGTNINGMLIDNYSVSVPLAGTVVSIR